MHFPNRNDAKLSLPGNEKKIFKKSVEIYCMYK